jgi:hypothetical protein
MAKSTADMLKELKKSAFFNHLPDSKFEDALDKLTPLLTQKAEILHVSEDKLTITYMNDKNTIRHIPAYLDPEYCLLFEEPDIDCVKELLATPHGLKLFIDLLHATGGDAVVAELPMRPDDNAESSSDSPPSDTDEDELAPPTLRRRATR